MKAIKVIFALTLITLLTLGLSGCESITAKRCLKHLSEKYNGQEFIVKYTKNGGLFGGGTDYLFCYPKGGDPDTDEVTVETWKPKGEERIFTDTYFELLIREDVEAEMLAILSDINLPMKVYNTEVSGVEDHRFDSTKTYADVKKAISSDEINCLFDFSIFLLCEDIENREQYANKIFDMLEKNNYRGLMAICVISDTDLFERVTRKNRNQLFEPNEKTMFLFSECIL